MKLWSRCHSTSSKKNKDSDTRVIDTKETTDQFKAMDRLQEEVARNEVIWFGFTTHQPL